MNADSVIGIDLGGTEIKSVAASWPEGETLNRVTVPTHDGEVVDGKPAFLAQVSEVIDRHESVLGKRATHIGLAAPGLPSSDGDAIAFMPGRMANLENLVWREALGRDHPIPVLNDAQAALMGEIWLGAAKGLDDVIMYTLGTGVGGAIYSGGRLLRGRFGRAGHLGHASVDFLGEPDCCNTPGSIEDAIGELTLAKRSRGEFTSTKELVEAYAKGDPAAGDTWLRSLKALAAAIVSMANAVDPEVVVIGGGITAAGDHLFEPLGELVAQREWRPGAAHIEIRKAALGTWAGAYGCAYHAAQLKIH